MKASRDSTKELLIIVQTMGTTSMDLFSKFTISHFIWYLVPGLGAFALILFPISLFSSAAAKTILGSLGPLGLLFVCVILGFFLDGLRLYRLKYKYNKIKDDFFLELQNIAGIKVNPYLIQNVLIDIARKKEITGISLHHAVWIMHGHFSIIFIIESIMWLSFGMFFLFFKICEQKIVFVNYEISFFCLTLICFVLMFLFAIIGFRFMQISNLDQENTNSMFVDFAKQNKDELKKLLNINKL